MRTVFLASLVFVSLLCAACSGDADGDDSSNRITEVTAVPTLTSVADKALPLDAYATSDEQYHQISLASVKLQRRCMSDYGIDFTFEPPPPPSSPAMTRRYLVHDRGSVEVNGYHPDPVDELDPALYTPRLTDEEMAVLIGESRPGDESGTGFVGEFNGKRIPAGGCIGQARKQLLEGASVSSDGNDLVDDLDSQAYASMLNDKRVQAVFADWSVCMRELGYQYATPGEANDDPQWQTELPTPKEKATAVADVMCKSKHNVLGVQYSVEGAYDKQLIEENAEALDEIKKLNDKRVKIAASILGGAS